MIFWLGLLTTLLGGLVGIGRIRKSIKDRWPSVRDIHLDRVAIVLLCVGIPITAIDYVSGERMLASLERAARVVRSFEIDFDVQFKSEWIGNPPASPRVMVMGRTHVATAELAQRGGGVRELELHMDREPSFGPSRDGWVHTSFRVRAEPGTWIVGSDAQQLTEIRKVTFIAYGVRIEDSSSGNFSIGGTSRVFINGKEAASIRFAPKEVPLDRLPLEGGNPEMSFNGTWALSLE